MMSLTKALFLMLALLSVLPSAWSGTPLSVRVVSSHADLVSGDSALIELRPASLTHWSAMLNGRDISRLFRPAADASSLLAILSDLKPGRNQLVVRVGGAVRAKLELNDHPISGPLVSGPQQQPFFCQTEASGLGPALDNNCSASTVVSYYYKSTQKPEESVNDKALKFLHAVPAAYPTGFKSYDTAHPPTDIAETVTANGLRLPFIVRRETGVINRAVYDIRFLDRPGTFLPTPWSRPATWNGRVIYRFGGGCNAGYRQGAIDRGGSEQALLGEGYATVSATLNIFGVTCNDVVSAETVAMVKEYFIKQFGEPVHTIGLGGSGGAMQAQLIAQNYPGLLDGIIVHVSFPDVVTTMQSVSDCWLLNRALQELPRWTDEQRTAVAGFATWRTCLGWAPPPMMIEASSECDQSMPKELVYSRRSNPKGVRCDLYDNEINVFGLDPKTGFARRPLDNTGVQYGLAAFNAGKIDAEQFVALNERVGGYDEDGNIVASRTAAEPGTVEIAYLNGLVLSGAGGLAQIPIIDWRYYLDDLGNNHDSFRSFVTRARLIARTGSAANQVIVTDPRSSPWDLLFDDEDPNPATSLAAARKVLFVNQMDRWLDAIGSDQEPGTTQERIARERPADVMDTCWSTEGKRYAGDGVYDAEGVCSNLYPRHADPSIAAGGPLTDDVLKCSLKDIRAEDYFQPLSSEHVQRLREVFPAGVCDYGRPGIGQTVSDRTWRRFGAPK